MYLAVIAIYCAVMLAIGFFSHKKIHSFSEYSLGDRSFGAFVIGISYLASEISVGTFTVAVSMIYRSGLSRIWIDFGLLISAILCWQLLAKRLRIMTEEAGNALTIPQYLANRFKSRSIRVFSAITVIFFLTFYISANLLGFAKMMLVMLNIPKSYSYILAFSIMVFYVCKGGFRATCATDVVQGFIMLFASLVLPIALASKFGINDIKTAVEVKSTSGFLWYQDFASLGCYLGFGLFLFGSPHTITRFMAIKSYKSLKKARNISIILNIVMYTGLVISAFYAITLLKDLDDAEVVIFELSKTFLHPLVGALVVCAIIAAMMSTVDSQLVLCATYFANDIYRFLKKDLSNKSLIKVSRVAVVIINIFALFLSAAIGESVLKLAVFALTGLGTCIGPTLIVALYSKSINVLSVFCGFMFSFFSTIVFYFFIIPDDPHMVLLPIFLGCLCIIYCVHLMQKLISKANIFKQKME